MRSISVPVRGQEAGPADSLLLDLLASLPHGIVYCGAGGEIIWANRAAAGILGRDLTATSRWPLIPAGWAVHEDGAPFGPDELPVQAALRTGQVVADVVVGVRDAGAAEIRWLGVTAVPAVREGQGPQTVFAVFADLTGRRRLEADLSARQRAGRERAALRERERAARAQAEYAGERLAFLLRAGAMAAASRDPQEMLEHAAELVVPALADHCMVMVPTEDGMLRATSLAHRDPARAPVLAEFGLHRIPAAGPMSTQKAYQTGTSQLAQDVSARLPQWHSLAPGLIGILARLRAESVLATPIMIGDRTAGVLTLARDGARPAFAPADVEVAEEFARRLSAGLATADTFAREHTIAETLQRSLLPDEFPDVGLDLAVRYLPATDGVHVGGAWYDAFPLPGGGIGLVIGDVAGHDLSSAAVMGQVRSLLRAYALDHADPAEVLRRTGEALLRLLPDALASAFYAVLDPATGELRYASAGHPPPLATDGNGTFCYLDDAAGTMLGAAPGMPQRTGRRRLPPGGGLLLYTDGLVEGRRRDLSEGLAALAASLAAVRPATAGEACQAAERLLAGPQSRADDVCLLAVRLPGRRARPAPPGRTARL